MHRVTFACDGRVQIAVALIVGSLSLLLSGCSADPNISNQPFIGTYEERRTGGSTTMSRHMYDGKGHFRSQRIAPYSSDYFVADLQNDQAFYVFESKRAYYPVQTHSIGTPILSGESAKLLGAKSLGAKTISGYKCHGWLMNCTSGAYRGPRETWTSDQYNLPVVDRFTQAKDGVKVTITLKSYEGDGAVDGMFRTPDGYRQVGKLDLLTGFLN